MINLQYAIFFAIAAMLAWGVADYGFAIAARRVGIVKTNIYFLVFTVIIFAILSTHFSLGVVTYGSVLTIIVLGAFVALGNLSFAKGLRSGNVSIITPIASTWVIITVLLSLLLLKEPLTLLELLGATAIIVGAVLTSFKLNDLRKARLKGISEGFPFAILTAVSWGVYYYMMGTFALKVGWFQAAFLYNIPAMSFVALFGLATKRSISFPKVPLVFLILGLGVLNTIGILGYNLSVTYGYIALTAPITSAAVIVAVVMALALLRERPERNQLLGIALVIAGILMTSI